MTQAVTGSASVPAAVVDTLDDSIVDVIILDDDGGLFFLSEEYYRYVQEPSQVSDAASVTQAVAANGDGDDGDDDKLPSSPSLECAQPRRSRLAWRDRLTRAAATAGRAVRRAAEAVDAALDWLTDGVAAEVRRRVRRGRHRAAPVGLHRTVRTLLGRERSSAEFTRAAQLRAREPRDAEDNLVFCDGDTFVSWIALALEATRGLSEARHPATARHFVCS